MDSKRQGKVAAQELGLWVESAARQGVSVESPTTTSTYTLQLPRAVRLLITLDRRAEASEVALPHHFVLRTNAPVVPPPLAVAAILVAHEVREADLRFRGESLAVRVVAPTVRDVPDAE